LCCQGEYRHASPWWQPATNFNFWSQDAGCGFSLAVPNLGTIETAVLGGKFRFSELVASRAGIGAR
jgi:hypothetical protein